MSEEEREIVKKMTPEEWEALSELDEEEIE